MAKPNATTTSRATEGQTRRAILLGLPLVVASAGMAAEAPPPSDTPILALYREYSAIKEIIRSTSSDELEDWFFAQSDRIEAAMTELPCTCAADFAAKMLVSHCDGDFSCLGKTDPVWVEARQLVGAI